MSEKFLGFSFSGCADHSAHDKTVYVAGDMKTVTLAVRYKNSERNALYEIELDADDLWTLGSLCRSLSRVMHGLP